MKKFSKVVVALATASLIFSATAATAAPAKPHKCGVAHVAKKPLGKKALAKKAAHQATCKPVKAKKK